MPSRLATSNAAALVSDIAAIAMVSVARSIFRGRPPKRPRARCRQPRTGALGNQFALELGEGGEDAEGKSPVRRRGIDLRTRTCEHLQSHIAGAQGFGGVDEVSKIAAEAIQLPDNKRIPRL